MFSVLFTILRVFVERHAPGGVPHEQLFKAVARLQLTIHSSNDTIKDIVNLDIRGVCCAAYLRYPYADENLCADLGGDSYIIIMSRFLFSPRAPKNARPWPISVGACIQVLNLFLDCYGQ